MKTIKKYPKAKLIGCKDHPQGCKLILNEGEYEYSKEVEVCVDYNKKGEILGIEFIEGLPNQSQQPKVIACQGEGEITCKKVSEESGTSSQYPSADLDSQNPTKVSEVKE